MSKNVVYIIIGLAVVALLGLYLQSVVVNALKPADDNLVIPDTHKKVTKIIKGRVR